MSDTKKIKEWEIERGVIFTGKDVDPDKKLSAEDFDTLLADTFNKGGGGVTGVNHADRAAFLKANGYKVTRENMVADLSAKQPKE